MRQALLRAAAIVLAALIGGGLTAPLAAQTWEGALERGGSVSVDRDSRRPVFEADGVQRPLWDGVHRLDDGSTVIVRDGVAVPTPSMLRAWAGTAPPRPALTERPCDQLVRKTCGFDDGCASAAACLHARSLRADAGREQAALPPSAGADPLTETSGRCRAALADPAFAPCPSLEATLGDSRCRALVEQTCGPAGQCASAPGCDAARQLLALETDERLVNDDPAAISQTGAQCVEALGQPFFARCAAAPPD